MWVNCNLNQAFVNQRQVIRRIKSKANDMVRIHTLFQQIATFSTFHFQHIAYAGEDDSFITNPHIISNSDMAVHLLARFIEMLPGLFANFSMTPLILLSPWSIIFIEWKILFSMS